jgi:hypothetical protein
MGLFNIAEVKLIENVLWPPLSLRQLAEGNGEDYFED